MRYLTTIYSGCQSVFLDIFSCPRGASVLVNEAIEKALIILAGWGGSVVLMGVRMVGCVCFDSALAASGDDPRCSSESAARPRFGPSGIIPGHAVLAHTLNFSPDHQNPLIETGFDRGMGHGNPVNKARTLLNDTKGGNAGFQSGFVKDIITQSREMVIGRQGCPDTEINF